MDTGCPCDLTGLVTAYLKEMRTHLMHLRSQTWPPELADPQTPPLAAGGAEASREAGASCAALPALTRGLQSAGLHSKDRQDDVCPAHFRQLWDTIGSGTSC